MEKGGKWLEDKDDESKIFLQMENCSVYNYEETSDDIETDDK